MSDICVCSHHTSVRDLLSDGEFLGLANCPGFLVELRLDQYSDLTPDSFDEILNRFLPRVVVTFRHPEEGGRNPNTKHIERLAYLQRAAHRGAEYVDIEARTIRRDFEKFNSKLILSFHDFDGVPSESELVAQWHRMEQSGADVIKIACAPKNVFDTLPLLKLLIHSQNYRRPTIVLGMGEPGLWTRICGAVFGAPFTFSRGENGGGTAPGQPTWRELDETYRYREIKTDWPVYCVIGNPIGHSLSPLMHNAAYKALKIGAVYVPFLVESDPARFAREFAPLLSGVSVTIPHKEAVMQACVNPDDTVKNIGAANTLMPAPPFGWFASNTDAPAAAAALEVRLGSLAGKTIAILGAGGAARAVAFGVKERGAIARIVNRTREKAEALSQAVNGEVLEINALKDSKIDAIVNTTPVGMFPKTDASPLESSQLPQGSVVFDTVYNPLKTKLLKLAEAAGCPTIPGVEMFVEQGARQFEVWFGPRYSAPRDVMRAVVLDALERRTESPESQQ